MGTSIWKSFCINFTRAWFLKEIILKDINRVKTKICVVVGTRPEAIKMAPIIQRLKDASWCEVQVLATAQHRQMLDQVFSLFGIEADVDLDLMAQNQTLSKLTARLIAALDSTFIEMRPDVILAQGDTTTVMCAALVAFYNKIQFGHVEAGLRTHDMYNPFPEEMNRVVVSRMAHFHFAPTQQAKTNLVEEGVPTGSIYVTGNTVIDALFKVPEQNNGSGLSVGDNKRIILVTAHRRENFGKVFWGICRGIKQIVTEFEDVEIIFPVHPNPNVREVVHGELAGNSRIHLCAPLDYGQFVNVMKKSYIVLTDSGGVQEEAPALGKPVLVLRNDTERPEAVRENVVKIIGTEQSSIFKEVKELLTDKESYDKMAIGSSPYGDGKAADRIALILHDAFVP